MRFAIAFDEELIEEGGKRTPQLLQAKTLLEHAIKESGLVVWSLGQYVIVSGGKIALGAEADRLNLRKVRKSDGNTAEFDIYLAHTFVGWDEGKQCI